MLILFHYHYKCHALPAMPVAVFGCHARAAVTLSGVPAATSPAMSSGSAARSRSPRGGSGSGGGAGGVGPAVAAASAAAGRTRGRAAMGRGRGRGRGNGTDGAAMGGGRGSGTDGPSHRRRILREYMPYADAYSYMLERGRTPEQIERILQYQIRCRYLGVTVYLVHTFTDWDYEGERREVNPE